MAKILDTVKPNGLKHPYRAEHIIVWEQANNKTLPKGWVVHHLNGIRDDNRIENLFGMPRKRHNLKLALEPYEKRIQELEDELRKLKQRNS
uniref:Putative homing endonuclease n=1 Tax=viral metagenome TaxID=1070528 RepID=A0A6M3IG98_9ZZZZ